MHGEWATSIAAFWLVNWMNKAFCMRRRIRQSFWFIIDRRSVTDPNMTSWKIWKFKTYPMYHFRWWWQIRQDSLDIHGQQWCLWCSYAGIHAPPAWLPDSFHFNWSVFFLILFNISWSSFLVDQGPVRGPESDHRISRTLWLGLRGPVFRFMDPCSHVCYFLFLPKSISIPILYPFSKYNFNCPSTIFSRQKWNTSVCGEKYFRDVVFVFGALTDLRIYSPKFFMEK